MASIIKGQILKHLSKFTKNMSPDKIRVSTLKGEGDLSNLELDECMIMEVLDLPTWLRLTRATCNRLAIKIQWTKLKNQPICIFLDEIVVEMETCDKPREQTNASQLAGLASGGKYGFAERIIDGMYVSINSVVVNFKAPAFHASIQLSRIVVASKTPTWQTGDLRLTRIKDELRGEILIFKEAEWQTLRIEANALEGADHGLATTPLRLIANQSKTRITIKKKLSDCGIIASKVQLNLDDLLWVLTDSQLKAAILFANSLREVVNKSAQQSKLMAAEKLQKQTSGATTPGTQQGSRKPGTKSQIAIAKLFAKYDVLETSYHLHTGRIDLHLCDDMAPEDDSYRRKVEGGAMQLTFHKLCLDFYPFHPAGSDRSHWHHSDENMAVRRDWATELLSSFKRDVGRVREAFTTSPNLSPDHQLHEAQRASVQAVVSKPRGSLAQGTASIKPARGGSATKLLESCVVMRLEDFTLYRVSTASDSKRSTPKKLLASDKKQLLLPPEMSSVHMEYTDYYFPEGIDYPVPHSNLYMNVNPVRLSVDYLSLVWLNSFTLNLLHSLDLPANTDPKIHIDMRIDALMPRIILPAETEIRGQPDRPDGLQIQVSKVTLTNSRVDRNASRTALNATLESYEGGALFSGSSFPHSESDLHKVPSAFRAHLERTDNSYLDPSIEAVLAGHSDPTSPRHDSLVSECRRFSSPRKQGKTYYNMSTDSLKQDGTKDVWCIAIDQFWVDFVGVPSSRNRPVPFIESFPLTLWVAMPLQTIQFERRCDEQHQQARTNGQVGKDEPRRSSLAKLRQYYSGDNEGGGDVDGGSKSVYAGECESRLADAHVLVDVGSKVSLELNHYQYLFLLRLMETITRCQEEVVADSTYILGQAPPTSSTVVCVQCREVELALVCPPLPQPHSTPTSCPDSMDELPTDGRKEECTDSAIGASICMDETEKPVDSLPLPPVLGKSHSDTEIINNSSPQEDESSLPVRVTGTHRSQQELSSMADASPKIYVGMSGASSPSDGGSLASSMNAGSESWAMDKRSGEIRKSFNNAFSNLSKLTEKVKHNVKKDLLDIGDELGDDWDTLSIKSGASSDDEDFVLLKFQNDTEVPAFERHHTASDTTSVAGSDKDDLSFGEISLASRHRGTVSIVSFRLVSVAAVLQMQNDDMAVAVTCDHVIPCEYGNIDLDKFQMKFSAATKDVAGRDDLPAVSSPPIKLRYSLGPAAEALAPTAGKLGYLEIDICRLRTMLLMSSMTNLVDLIEDEVIPDAMPMRILVRKVDITLKMPVLLNPLVQKPTGGFGRKVNDAPPTHPTSPGIVPLDLHVSEALVTRGQDGIFRVTTVLPESVSPEPAVSIPPKEHASVESLVESLLQESASLKQQLAAYKSREAMAAARPDLEHENDQLRRQLEKVAKLDGAALTERLRRDADLVREQQRVSSSLQHENGQLLEELMRCQQESKALREERLSLMTTITLLQEELAASEKMRRKASSSS